MMQGRDAPEIFRKHNPGRLQKPEKPPAVEPSARPDVNSSGVADVVWQDLLADFLVQQQHQDRCEVNTDRRPAMVVLSGRLRTISTVPTG